MSIPPFKIENIDLNYMRQRQMSKSKSKEQQQQQPTKTTDAKQWYSLSNDFDRDRFRKTCEEFVQNDKRVLNRALDAEEEGDEMLVEAVKMVYKVESRRGLKEVLGRERKEAIIRHGLRYILTDDKKIENLMEHYNLLVPSDDDKGGVDREPQQQNKPVITGITDEDASSNEDMYALLLAHGVDLGKSEESINYPLEKPESPPVKSTSQASSGEQSLDGDSPFFSYGEASSSNTGEDSNSGTSSTTLDSGSGTPSSCSSPQPQIHKTCIVATGAPGKTSAAGEPITCAESSPENTDLSDIRHNQALAMANRRIKSPWISGFLFGGLSSRTGQPLVSNYATRNETSPPKKSDEKENTETNNSSRPRSQSDPAYRKISMKDLNIKNSWSGNKAVVNTSTEVLGKGSVNDTSSNLPVVPEKSNDDDRGSHGWDEEILDLPKSEDSAKRYTMGPTQKLSRS